LNTKARRRFTIALAAGASLVLIGSALAAKPQVGPPPPKLFAVVDDTAKISLKDGHGKAVAHLKTGWYTLTINDANSAQQFRLKGPGINRATSPKFVGAAIWGVHLLKGKYSYSSVGDKTIVHSFSVS
jgi:hypothetical protein